MGVHLAFFIYRNLYRVSEASQLLKHPDPRERALALKLKYVTPQDVGVAILDPDPRVWKAAMAHPESHYALHVLAAHTRDAAGVMLHDRHDALLGDPRCNAGHLESMAQAVGKDTQAPVQVQADRIRKIRSHAKYQHPTFSKSESSDLFMKNHTSKNQIADHTKEFGPHKALGDYFTKNKASFQEIHTPDSGFGSTKKIVYKTPTDHIMTKPYHYDANPLQGWGEATSQHIAHAAGLGHLHQKSAVVMHGEGEAAVPVTAIKMERSMPVHESSIQEVRKNNPGIVDDAKKLTFLDFLTSNIDRHHGNFRILPNNGLLAIDHGSAFFPFDDTPKDTLEHYINQTGPATVTGTTNINQYIPTLKAWWPTVKDGIQKAFNERIGLIKNPDHQSIIASEFNHRYKYLDSLASGTIPLQKAMEGVHFLPKQHLYPMNKTPNMAGVHDKLKMAHPKAIEAGRLHFEKNINQNPKAVKPLRSYIPDATRSLGEEPKTIFGHEGKRYMVKGATGPTTRMGGWNELTAQAMYHSAGIGHLHQAVHATTHKFHNGPEATDAIAIHMAPETSMPLAEAMPWEGRPGEPERMNKMFGNNTHLGNIRKMGLMNFITGDNDGHSGNVMIHKDGSLLKVDSGRAFLADRKHAIGHEGEQDKIIGGQQKRDLTGIQPYLTGNPHGQMKAYGGNNDHAVVLDQRAKYLPIEQRFDFPLFGGNPDHETWGWWDQNKHNIRNAFQKHLSFLPDQNVRNKMQESFDVRWNHLNTMSRNSVKPNAAPEAKSSEAITMPSVMVDSNKDAYHKTIANTSPPR